MCGHIPHCTSPGYFISIIFCCTLSNEIFQITQKILIVVTAIWILFSDSHSKKAWLPFLLLSTLSYAVLNIYYLSFTFGSLCFYSVPTILYAVHFSALNLKTFVFNLERHKYGMLSLLSPGWQWRHSAYAHEKGKAWAHLTLCGNENLAYPPKEKNVRQITSWHIMWVSIFYAFYCPPSLLTAIGKVTCSLSETVMFCQQLETETQMQATGLPHDT